MQGKPRAHRLLGLRLFPAGGGRPFPDDRCQSIRKSQHKARAGRSQPAPFASAVLSIWETRLRVNQPEEAAGAFGREGDLVYVAFDRRGQAVAPTQWPVSRPCLARLAVRESTEASREVPASRQCSHGGTAPCRRPEGHRLLPAASAGIVCRTATKRSRRERRGDAEAPAKCGGAWSPAWAAERGAPRFVNRLRCSVRGQSAISPQRRQPSGEASSTSVSKGFSRRIKGSPATAWRGGFWASPAQGLRRV